MARTAVISCLMLIVSGCGSGYPPPPGFIDACYGGNSRSLEGAVPRFTMRLHALPTEWPRLSRRLRDFGGLHRLAFFDESMTADGLRMIGVYLCSPEGLMIMADKRLWDSWTDPHPDLVEVVIYQYRPQMDWAPVALALERSFDDWPGGVQTRRPSARK